MPKIKSRINKKTAKAKKQTLNKGGWLDPLMLDKIFNKHHKNKKKSSGYKKRSLKGGNWRSKRSSGWDWLWD